LAAAVEAAVAEFAASTAARGGGIAKRLSNFVRSTAARALRYERGQAPTIVVLTRGH
jgi:hypothetical protein